MIFSASCFSTSAVVATTKSALMTIVLRIVIAKHFDLIQTITNATFRWLTIIHEINDNDNLLIIFSRREILKPVINLKRSKCDERRQEEQEDEGKKTSFLKSTHEEFSSERNQFDDVFVICYSSRDVDDEDRLKTVTELQISFNINKSCNIFSHPIFSEFISMKTSEKKQNLID
ncbi:CLUMA_CG005625, isoform A [Clunio marinus]|uniref:CLUMA_CG005625, isoform A n=1 Tax=Clunio marinus TaxID=568069 RepID=A0A1J1HVJ9_9DIPT|nr:CLUMA_CG005625, isoform A [Clunio marinus]